MPQKHDLGHQKKLRAREKRSENRSSQSAPKPWHGTLSNEDSLTRSF
jgi:hypothetical protein